LIDVDELFIGEHPLFFNQAGTDRKVQLCVRIVVHVIVPPHDAGSIIVTLPCDKFIAMLGFSTSEDGSVEFGK